MKELIVLSIPRVQIPNPVLKSIAANCDLCYLDLSGTNFSKGTADALTSTMSLKYLSLRDCKIDEKELLRLTRHNPNLRIELAVTDVSVATLTKLTAEGKIASSAQMKRAIDALYPFNKADQCKPMISTDRLRPQKASLGAP